MAAMSVTALSSTAGGLTPVPVAIRLRPAPPLDPPYDDEVTEPRLIGESGFAMLPLDWPRLPGLPQPASSAPGSPEKPPGAGVQTRGSAESGQARYAAQRFVGVCVEVLNGFRPATHLRALAAPADLPLLVDQVLRRTVRMHLSGPPSASSGSHSTGHVVGSGLQQIGPGSPSRPTPTGHAARFRQHQVRVRGIRLCEPREGITELAAVLAYGQHTWAMAARLERRRESWQCRLVQVL
jgi:uncharacterized protein DUF6459